MEIIKRLFVVLIVLGYMILATWAFVFQGDPIPTVFWVAFGVIGVLMYLQLYYKFK